MLKSKLFSAISAALLTGFFASGQAAPIASGFISPLSQLPPIGLAASETAQVNLVNNATQANGATAPSCTGSVTFYNASGTVIGKPTSFSVGSGQIFSVMLPYSSTEEPGSRTVIRAAVTLTASIASLRPPPGCALASSLETYDTSTGVTHAFVAGAGQNPLPAFWPLIP